MKEEITKDLKEIIDSNPLIRELYEIASVSPAENIKAATFLLHALNSRNAKKLTQTTKEV